MHRFYNNITTIIFDEYVRDFLMRNIYLDLENAKLAQVHTILIMVCIVT